ncbi:MAG: tetratricopeptide repeat protein [Planctomycetota bacterium]|jgi:hypothetical protein
MIVQVLKTAVFLLLFVCGCTGDKKEVGAELFDRAHGLFIAEKISDAEQLLLEIIDDNPYFIEANLLLANIHEVHHGDYAQAAAYYKRVGELARDSSKIRQLADLKCDLLKRITDGIIEDPENTLEEIIFSLKRNDKRIFFLRMHGSFIIKKINDKKSLDQVMKRMTDELSGRDVIVKERLFSSETMVMKLDIHLDNKREKSAELVFLLSDDKNNWSLFDITLNTDKG